MKKFAKQVMELIKKREFISVATCDFNHRPNAAPKFVLKIDKNYIYLVDYTIGKTWQNLKINPRASLSLMDAKSLTGYQINGSVEIIDKGPEYKKIYKEKTEKEISLTTKHIIEEVRGEAKQERFEVIMPERFVILKIKLEEVVEIGPRGGLRRERV